MTSSVERGTSLMWCGALLLGFACSVEERPLSYGSQGASGLSQAGRAHYDPGAAGAEGTPWAGGGQGGGAGESAAPDEAGAPSSGGTGGSSSSNGGSSSGSASPSGGSASSGGGSVLGGMTSTMAGSSTGGAPTGGGGVLGGSGTGGQGASGAAGSASAGTGGSDPNQGRCGDLDTNGVQDCEETAVHNATFDTDTHEWLADPGVATGWKQQDALGSAGSGALSVKFTASDGSGAWATSAAGQCVQAWEGTELALGGRTLIPDGQGTGTAQLNLAMFGNDGCAGSFIAMTTPLFSAQTGSWQSLRGVVKLAPGTRSVMVRLAVTKPGSQPSFEVLFDNILLRAR